MKSQEQNNEALVSISAAIATFAIYSVGSKEAAHVEGLILVAARAGDRRARQIFDDRFRKSCIKFVRGLGASYENAEDVVQEVLLKALTPDTAWVDLHQTWPWLKTVARNKYIDMCRKKQPVFTPIYEQTIEQLPGQSEIDEVDKRLRLSEALMKLPFDERQTVARYFIEGWTLHEIAEQTARSVSIVFNQKKTGVQKLKAYLGD